MVIKCPLEVRLSARDTFGLLPACTDLFVPRVRASTAHASQPHDETQTSPDLVGDVLVRSVSFVSVCAHDAALRGG